MLPDSWLCEWQPAAPPLRILAGVLVLVGLSIWAYWRPVRERPVAGFLLLAWRLLVVAAMALILMGPSREVPSQRISRRPRVSILLDTSASMLTTDVDGQSRIEFARTQWLTPERMRRLSDHFEVDVQRFDVQTQPLATSQLASDLRPLSTGRGTRLAEAVLWTASRMPSSADPGAMLVLSDGHDTDQASIQPAAALAKTKQIAVSTVTLGGSRSERDVALLAIPMQEYLLPNEPGAILVKVYQSGFDQSQGTLRWRQGEAVKMMPIDFQKRRIVEVQVPIQQAEPGEYEYTLEIDPLPGEAESANNRQRVFCDVQRRRMKVLLLEGQPFWDTKFLAQALRKDERIDLTQLTQVSTEKRETLVTRTETKAPTVPATREEWGQFDVVILGRQIDRLLPDDGGQQLATFVADQGGHVVFARGPACDTATPRGQKIAADLAILEPVEWGVGTREQLSLAIAPSGRTSQWFSATKMGLDVEKAFSRLPGFTIAPHVDREKPAALVLLRASANPGDPGQPALCTMNYGRGSVVGVLGEGLWRWSLLSQENRDLAGFYDTFWSNLVRWLTMGGDFLPGQQVSLQISRTSVRKGDPLVVDVLYKVVPPAGTAPRLELIDPLGGHREVALSPTSGRDPRFRTTIEPADVGAYTLQLSSPGMTPPEQHRRFNVYHIDDETLDTSANPLVLQMLADHTGGRVYGSKEAETWLRDLERQQELQQAPPRREYIWDHWTVMVILLVGSGVEWIARRRLGLA